MTGLNNTNQANDANLGVVHAIRLKVDSTMQGAGAQSIGKVPGMALVIGAEAGVTEAFDGTTPTLDIGTAADPDGLASALALGVKGLIGADDLATSDDIYNSVDTEFVATVAGTGATVGTAYVTVRYVIGND